MANEFRKVLEEAQKRARAQGKKPPIPEEEVLRLWEDGYNVREIATELGYGEGAVRRVLHKYGLSVRAERDLAGAGEAAGIRSVTRRITSRVLGEISKTLRVGEELIQKWEEHARNYGLPLEEFLDSAVTWFVNHYHYVEMLEKKLSFEEAARRFYQSMATDALWFEKQKMDYLVACMLFDKEPELEALLSYAIEVARNKSNRKL